jgi:DNA-binding PadR family transcriptional regulator
MLLAVLAIEPRHGYAILKSLRETSEGLFTMREGKLYPLLHEMENRGWIQAQWQTPESGPARRVYHIQPAGKDELKRRRKDWAEFQASVNAFMSEGEARVKPA